MECKKHSKQSKKSHDYFYFLIYQQLIYFFIIFVFVFAYFKESVDIKHLRKDLDAGLAKAVIVLDETKALLAVSRKDRECLILQRRNEVKTAQNLQAWLKKRF
jgi:hypothetical protein